MTQLVSLLGRTLGQITVFEASDESHQKLIFVSYVSKLEVTLFHENTPIA